MLRTFKWHISIRKWFISFTGKIKTLNRINNQLKYGSYQLKGNSYKKIQTTWEQVKKFRFINPTIG